MHFVNAEEISEQLSANVSAMFALAVLNRHTSSREVFPTWHISMSVRIRCTFRSRNFPTPQTREYLMEVREQIGLSWRSSPEQSLNRSPNPQQQQQVRSAGGAAPRRFSSHEYSSSRASGSATPQHQSQRQQRSISGYAGRIPATETSADAPQETGSASSRSKRQSFHNAVAATSDSGDLTAYYAFSRRRSSSASVVRDEAGRCFVHILCAIARLEHWLICCRLCTNKQKCRSLGVPGVQEAGWLVASISVSNSRLSAHGVPSACELSIPCDRD